MPAAAVTADRLALSATTADGAADSSRRAVAALMPAGDPARTEITDLGWRVRIPAVAADLPDTTAVTRPAAATDDAANTSAAAIQVAVCGIRTPAGLLLSAWLPWCTVPVHSSCAVARATGLARAGRWRYAS